MPMFTSILAFVVIRQIFLKIVLNIVHDITIIGYSYSFTWILAAIFTATYYYKSCWLKKEMAKV